MYFCRKYGRTISIFSHDLLPSATVVGKVMFSQACVKNSVRGECLPHCMLGYTPPGKHPLVMATTTDGTHPTGMHS